MRSGGLALTVAYRPEAVIPPACQIRALQTSVRALAVRRKRATTLCVVSTLRTAHGHHHSAQERNV